MGTRRDRRGESCDPHDRIANAVAALESHGVVERRDAQVRLSPAYAALSAEEDLVGLDGIPDMAEMMTRLVPEAAQETGDRREMTAPACR